MKPSEVLRKAADVLKERGWHQGALAARTGGAVCAVGAIRIAVHGNVEYPFANESLYCTTIDSLGLPAMTCPADWNDRPDRTRAQVLRRFAAAARRLEKAGK